MQQLAKERGFAVGEPGNVARSDAVDREPRAGIDDDFEGGAAEPVEQQAPEQFEAAILRDAETDKELQLGIGLEICAPGAAVELILELGKGMLV